MLFNLFACYSSLIQKLPHMNDTTKKKKKNTSVFNASPRPPKKSLHKMMKFMIKNTGQKRAKEDEEMREGFSLTCRYKVIEFNNPVYVVQIESTP